MGGKVILIEGLDLAGKSTLVRNLRDEMTRRGIPVRVSRNALCPENPIAPVADALRRDPEAGLLETGALFMASHMWDARHFRRPPVGMVHIQDSCWLRTLAYHTMHETPGISAQLAAVAVGFPRFDATVFLTAGLEERVKRLWQREEERPGSNDADDHLVNVAPDFFLNVEKCLLDYAIAYTEAAAIDTTQVKDKELLKTVLKVLKLNN